MQKTLTKHEHVFSWKALGWALIYFWYFSTLLQIIICLTGYSGTNGLRDSLLFSSLWLIPVFSFPRENKGYSSINRRGFMGHISCCPLLLSNLRAGILSECTVRHV